MTELSWKESQNCSGIYYINISHTYLTGLSQIAYRVLAQGHPVKTYGGGAGGDTQLKFNRRKLIYACDILINVSFYSQPFFEKQHQFSTSGWQTIAGAADELQATTEYGFPPVYIAVSNKCLLAVKCSGTVAKYIPQGSSTKTVLAIKGKKDREETVEAASHH